MTFNEADHPRHRGAFVDKPQSAPDAEISPTTSDTFTVTCADETHEHKGPYKDAITQFDSETLAEDWINDNSRSHPHFGCDLWISYSRPVLDTSA